MKKYLKENPLRKGDEAYIIVDRDEWPLDKLHLLQAWSQEKDHYNFLVSNPRFELWLSLHGISVNDNSMKNIETAHIHQAIAAAKKRDQPPCEDWPKDEGITTVYKLVEKIFSS